MLDNTTIHPLASSSKKSGKIRFIHSDGNEHYFYTCVNDLSGDRLSAFDNDPPRINSDMSWIKSIFSNIRKNNTVLEIIGDF